MSGRRLPLVIAVVLVAAACADEPAEPPVVMPATIEQLTGAWAVQPYLLDPAIWKRAEDACRLEIQLPPGTTAILVDGRGAGVLTVRMTGQTAGLCSALQILGDGTVVGAGGGWSSGGPEQIVPAPGRKLVGAERQEVGGGDLKTSGWSVMGQAGFGIAAVTVDPQGGHPVVQATLMNGWFAAWWPALPGEGDSLAGGAQRPQVVVRAYDPAGVVVDEIQT